MGWWWAGPVRILPVAFSAPLRPCIQLLKVGGSHLHQVRLQMRMVALVHTQVLMAMPVPNMENRLIFSTIRLGRFLMVHSGIGLLV